VAQAQPLDDMDVALQPIQQRRSAKSMMLTGLRGVGKTVILNAVGTRYTLDIYLRGDFMERAKIFQSGHSQAVRLPKEFCFNGSEVFIKRIGKAVVLLPLDDA